MLVLSTLSRLSIIKMYLLSLAFRKSFIWDFISSIDSSFKRISFILADLPPKISIGNFLIDFWILKALYLIPLFLKRHANIFSNITELSLNIEGSKVSKTSISCFSSSFFFTLLIIVLFPDPHFPSKLITKHLSVFIVITES